MENNSAVHYHSTWHLALGTASVSHVDEQPLSIGSSPEASRSRLPAPRARTVGVRPEQVVADEAARPGGSAPPPTPLTFDDVAEAYLKDYAQQRYRSLNTAKGRVAHLRRTFGGREVGAITTDAIRQYQLRRRGEAAETATINRETSALSRMLRLPPRIRTCSTSRTTPAGGRTRSSG
jgi:hypothetical protein